MYKQLEEWKRPGNIGKWAFFIGVIILIAVPAWMQQTRKHNLQWYRTAWCEQQNGVVAAKMPDQTTCDCLTETHAVTVAFADHWQSTVGQALYSSLQTGKEAGIVLVVEAEAEDRYRRKLVDLLDRYRLPVTVWTTGEAG